VSATDPDGPATTYSIAGGADAALFTIDPTTGALSFLSAPDWEIPTDAGGNNVYNVVVQASDGVGGIDTQSLSITVTDTNEFPVSPVTDADAAVNAVNENAANGTLVGITATASDADVTDTIAFSLDDDAGGRFAIDANTGVVTVADGTLLDFETAASHGITVRATSSDGSFSTQNFTINLNALNDSDPTITSDGGGAVAPSHRGIRSDPHANLRHDRIRARHDPAFASACPRRSA